MNERDIIEIVLERLLFFLIQTLQAKPSDGILDRVVLDSSSLHSSHIPADPVASLSSASSSSERSGTR